MKQIHYKQYDHYLEITKNMKDYEDRRICAELFCFGTEREAIQFLTFDNDFRKFLEKYGQPHKVKLLTT